MSKVFKLVKTNSALDFLKNNTSSATASEDIIFDKIQGRVSFNYYERHLHIVLIKSNEMESDSPGQRDPWTETPLDRHLLRQRPLDRDSPGQTPLTETPPQRPPSGQRPSLDRDPLGRDYPGQRPPPLDRDPHVNRITDRYKNITFP